MNYLRIFSVLWFVGILSGLSFLLSEGMAVPEEDLDNSTKDAEEVTESVEKHLELPDVYENTIIYNGTLSPEFPWDIKFLGENEGKSLYVNDNGQFSIILIQKDLKAGDEITFFITGGEGNENMVRTVEVKPEKKDKEYIESSSDMSDVADVILENTTIEWLDSKQEITFEVETTGDLEGAPFYGLKNNPIDKHKSLELLPNDKYQAHISAAQKGEEVDNPDSVSPGDNVKVYLTGLGVTAIAETEVPEDLLAFDREPDESRDMDEENSTTSNEETPDENKSDNSSDDKGISSLVIWSIILIIILVVIVGIVIRQKRKNKK